jgi:hypothetical protein
MGKKRTFTHELIAQILVEVEFSSTIKAVAQRWDISTRTIERWRSLYKQDREMAAMIARYRARIMPLPKTWQIKIKTVLYKALDKLDALLDNCNDETHLPQVLAAIQTVGELMITQQVLGSDSFTDQHSEAEEAPIRS